MDSKKITAEYRTTKWAHIIKERQESGKTIEEFCQEKGISKNSYYYWQRKLRKEAYQSLKNSGELSTTTQTGWIQLTGEYESKEKIEIEINGCKITVGIETDPNLLRNVCNVLRKLQ